MRRKTLFLLVTAYLLAPAAGLASRQFTPPPILTSVNVHDDTYLVTDLFWTVQNPGALAQTVSLELMEGSSTHCQTVGAATTDSTYIVNTGRIVSFPLDPGARRIVHYFFLCAALTTGAATIKVGAMEAPASLLMTANPAPGTPHDYQGSLADQWMALRVSSAMHLSQSLQLQFRIAVAQDRGAVTASITGRTHQDNPANLLRGATAPPYVPLNSARPF